ncbi:MAG: radical SAM protein [Candidatus Omnitrophica bacterium]|nr:radical SAM protein [Candidatus Omnitrophota bacterium]MDE2008579.1 radical SAM protein [Candidatus Omnitrophota bacterium]MDE2214045.1 radical SAM protein [Candidatus Omnitrophota bacterium]
MDRFSSLPLQRPSVPLEIIVEITGRCRQVCPYCTGPRIPDVPFKDIKAALDEAAGLGVRAIRITGGEPTLHPDIRQILTYTKAKKFDIILNTSADNISAALMKTIIATVDVAHVSLQGYDEKNNASYTRSKVPFLDKIKNIFLLKAYLPTLWIATVITPAKPLKPFIPIIKKIHPAAWLLQRPISESNEDLKKMDIPYYRALALEIMKLRKERINAFISNPIPLCVAGNLDIGQQVFLGAKLDEGHLRIVRSAKGYFKPNYFLETNLGRTLQAAWQHPFLNDLNRTDYLPDDCQRCPLLETCRGGSRSMALRTHGTPLAADPLFDASTARRALSKYDPKPQRL